jgi:hypothetical protein
MAKQGQHKDDPTNRSRSPNERGPMGEQVRGMPPDQVRPGDQHPERYRHDLNPDPMAGQNYGMTSEPPMGRTAFDVKDAHRTWSELSDADLKQIRLLDVGTRLQQGAVYFDMNDPARGEFEAMGNMTAGRGQYLVAKDEVDDQLWNALIGVRAPERLGTPAR